MTGKKFVILSVAIWLIALSSLLGVHFFLKKAPFDETIVSDLNAIVAALDEHQQRSVMLYETGIIKLKDGDYQIIGSGFEEKEKLLLSEKKLQFRKLDHSVEDPELIERRLQIGEAFKTLNNAEKNCLAKKHGTVLFKNGEVLFVYDPIVYAEYVKKYGTECQSCEEKKQDMLKRRVR